MGAFFDGIFWLQSPRVGPRMGGRRVFPKLYPHGNTLSSLDETVNARVMRGCRGGDAPRRRPIFRGVDCVALFRATTPRTPLGPERGLRFGTRYRSANCSPSGRFDFVAASASADASRLAGKIGPPTTAHKNEYSKRWSRQAQRVPVRSLSVTAAPRFPIGNCVADGSAEIGDFTFAWASN